MDESKDKELEGEAVETVVTSTTTTTETVIKTVVTSSEVEESQVGVGVSDKVAVEEGDDGGCEVGDVMVEVLGSEVVFDGVKRISGEMGGDELSSQRSDFSAVNDDGDLSIVGESGGCHDVLALGKDVSASCGGRGVTSQLGIECVGGRSAAFGGSQDGEGCDIGKEKTIEVVVDENTERTSGDAGGQQDVELVDYETELRGVDNGSNVLHSTIKSTSNGKMAVNEEESLEPMKEEDEIVNSTAVDLDIRPREQDDEGDEQVVLEVGHGCGNVPEDETVDGGIKSGEGSITCGQEKPDILESVSGNAENANSKQLDLHTQSSVIGSVDGANESIPVPEPDKQINVTMIKERLQPVDDEKFNDAALTASIGHQNGALDETKLDETDIEIDVPCGSLIHFENLPVDVKERGKDIETSVFPAIDAADASLSRVSEGETFVVEMDIDAADANVGNNGEVCETPHDDLKTENENQVSEAVILDKCNSRIALADNSHKSFDPIASLSIEKQYTGLEGKMQNIVENITIGTPALDTKHSHVSVVGTLTTNLLDDSKQDGKSSAAPVPGVVEGAIQESQCVPDASNIECLDYHHTVEGVDEIGLNRKDLQEVQEAIHSDQGSVECDLLNEGEEPMHGEQVSPDYDLPNVSAGPFIVETEDPDDSAVGSGYVDVDSGPSHDNNGMSDAHVVHPLVEGLEQEAEDDTKSDSDMEDAQDEQEESANTEQIEEQEVDEEHVSGSEKSRNKEEKKFAPYPIAESLLKDHRVSYQLPPELDGEFSVSDMVWGKVKSHPWWPGQIFHPSDSSEKAMKYLRKDCYLVAYFGDRTFAWNEHSVLKPFRNHFSVAERQIKSESFQNAVECALSEVSRRTELGLACSCASQEAYNKIRYQMVENAGIKKESSKRYGVDRCTELDSFQPDKLVGYVRSLAVFPTSSVDRLELVIAKAQLTAFVRLQGIDALADYQYYEGISSQAEHEDSAMGLDSKITLKGPKRKHNLKDIVYQRRREKSMTELMGETMYYLDGEFDSHEEDENMLHSPTFGVKRKTAGLDEFTKTISVAKVSHAASSNPQQTFKVGDCIRRVANQLTGSSSISKGSNDGDNIEHLGDGADEVLEASNDSPTEMPSSPSQQLSLEEILSQLHLCAQDPMKGYSFLSDIVIFFSGIRNMAVSMQRQRLRKRPGRKQKASTPIVGIPESFEFDDRNDSYWKDMVVQDDAEAKPARRSRKRKDEQVLSVDSEKPSQSKPRKSSRKQYFHGPLSTEVQTPLGDEGKQSQLPTELVMIFTGTGSIPSEMNLNKMFRSFGPLKESETEIDTQSSRARVVFKKRSDAEVAYSSAAMFNIFGSLLVNYQLNYTPSSSLKAPPLALTDSQEKAS